MRVLLRAAIVASVLAPAITAAAPAPGDPDAGRQLAQTWCDACHRVDPRDPTPTSDLAPSFDGIASRRSTTPVSLRAFLHTSHRVMPNFSLTEAQINDVTAYILSLRRPSRPQ